jgi:Restriction endonuclease NotI
VASRIVEFFGYDPQDRSRPARNMRRDSWCPFLDAVCQKTLRDGSISGACTLKPLRSEPVIICPIRLYDDDYRILKDVAEASFGAGTRLIMPADARRARQDGNNVAVFGRRWGGELRLPQRQGTGGYFVDWVLARIGTNGRVSDFVAVEVQSIDTTGNYREERDTYLRERDFNGTSTAGLNWENVNKRILPQIIYKGHVLRREPLCQKGLFFVCPQQVWERIRDRLGGVGVMMQYQLQPGAVTFRWYNVSGPVPPGQRRDLVFGGQFTTTVDQVALAFTAPQNLPAAGVYEAAIQSELR